MTTLSKPATYYPNYEVNADDIMTVIEICHPDSPHKKRAFDMIQNAEVKKRHLIMPLTDVVKQGNFGERAKVYQDAAIEMAEKVAREAIHNARLNVDEIDMVIATSCTGFMMPSLTAHLINRLSLRADTKQIPIAQLGCVAGASAIGRAFEYCEHRPDRNVLIVCVETSSLCFHKEAGRLQDFISNSLFADGAAAVVMRGDDQISGLRLTHNQSVTIEDTMPYIEYQLTDKGFKFSLDKDVMHSIPHVAPYLQSFCQEKLEIDANDVDNTIFHTGGRRILDELERCLNLDPDKVKHSRACLAETGNTSSVAVIDVLRRTFEQATKGETSLLAAFGPGFTSEMSVGVWQ
ncbi:type III polyketide synthase PhlD [Pseudoalteromonas luteoviolacea]|uniref:Type III polyketide synthase PhlD n=1 Tax=Pseudoalteromonas luteoviolacea TaxID=43657 RepID=A0A0C1QQV4_9GAMM|nr:type III polyketide synthase [Pseudoalteromonas luteoviolacea]KID57437.1 type III polyketide synthase PhlD [Pseudoalteromonas luteoviolacea]